MNINHESHAISRRSFLKASGVVGAAGILAACGGSSSSSTAASASSGATSAPNTTGATPLKEFISWESTNRELESWNMLYTQMASDMNVITNLWEGLLSFDCYGKAVPSVAKEWSHNEDSSVWTFNLRDDVDWVDVNGEVKAHLTSKDFLVGLEWVLNAAKNQANNTSMPSETAFSIAANISARPSPFSADDGITSPIPTFSAAAIFISCGLTFARESLSAFVATRTKGSARA